MRSLPAASSISSTLERRKVSHRQYGKRYARRLRLFDVTPRDGLEDELRMRAERLNATVAIDRPLRWLRAACRGTFAVTRR